MKTALAVIIFAAIALSNSRQESLESIGMTKIQQLRSLPESIITPLITPLIVTACLPDSGDSVVKPEGGDSKTNPNS